MPGLRGRSPKAALTLSSLLARCGWEELPPPLNFSCLLQALSAISQPVYQILAPKYSERWFDLKGRTTATMIISIGIDLFLTKRNTNHSSSSQRILSVVG